MTAKDEGRRAPRGGQGATDDAQGGDDREHAETRGDNAPGDESGRSVSELRGYIFGLVLATLLTAASFTLAASGLVYGPAVPVALLVLAVAQMGVHLVFFIHITSAPDNTNNILSLAFGLLITLLVVVGSIWIMANLDANMMPMPGAGSHRGH